MADDSSKRRIGWTENESYTHRNMPKQCSVFGALLVNEPTLKMYPPQFAET